MVVRTGSAKSGEPAIIVNDLHKTYVDGLFRKRRVKALRGVTFTVKRGDIFGLLGPNGAGKTTIIKVLLDIVRRSSGEAQLLGRPTGDRYSRRNIGYLPENHRFPQHLTGNTALEYFGMLSNVSLSEVRAKRPALLETVGLSDWGKTPVRQYSKGMQQRLGIAQAMIHDPELLILDEPTDGVDPVGRKDLRVLLQQLKEQGKTIFINSHLLQEVELVCDHVVILTNGKVQRAGSIEELTQGPSAEFTFTLHTTAETAGPVLQGLKVLRTDVGSMGHLVVTIGAEDQTEIDQSVDSIRAADISIVSMAGQRRTLEDAFLDIVDAEQAELNQNAVDAEVI